MNNENCDVGGDRGASSRKLTDSDLKTKRSLDRVFTGPSLKDDLLILSGIAWADGKTCTRVFNSLQEYTEYANYLSIKHG